MAPIATHHPGGHCASDGSADFHEAVDSGWNLSSPSSLSIITPCHSNETPMTPTHELGRSTAFHDATATSALHPFDPSTALSSAFLNSGSRHPSLGGILGGLSMLSDTGRVPLRRPTALGSVPASGHLPPTFKEDELNHLPAPEITPHTWSTSAAEHPLCIHGQIDALTSVFTTQPWHCHLSFVSRSRALEAETTQFSLLSNPLHSARRASLPAVEESEESAPVFPAVRNAEHYRPASSSNPAACKPSAVSVQRFATLHCNPFFEQGVPLHADADAPVNTTEPPVAPMVVQSPVPRSVEVTPASVLLHVQRAEGGLLPKAKTVTAGDDDAAALLNPPSSSGTSHYGSASAGGPEAPPTSSESLQSSAELRPGCSAPFAGLSGLSSGFVRGLGGASSHMHAGASAPGVKRVHSFPARSTAKPKKVVPGWMSQPLRAMRRPAGRSGVSTTPVAIAENDVPTRGGEFAKQGGKYRKLGATVTRVGKSMKLMAHKAASKCAKQARRVGKQLKRT